MKTPQEMAQMDYFLDFLLEKRWQVNGTDTDIEISFDELDTTYFSSVEALISVLDQMKVDSINIQIDRRVIESYKQNENNFIIKRSNREGLDLYKKSLIGNNLLHADIRKLKELELNFNEITSEVYFTGLDDHKLALPVDGYELGLLKVLFDNDKKRGVDWSEVYEHIHGVDADKTNKGSIYDTTRRFNRRVQRYFGIPEKNKIVKMDNNTIKRLM
jgi:hypothetical protein